MNADERVKTYPNAHVTIKVWSEDTARVYVHVSATGDPENYGRLSPDEARDVANHLLQAASVAERNVRDAARDAPRKPEDP